MIEIILALLFGLLIGSFLNVCVFRLPRDLSVVRPGSFCPDCVVEAEEKGLDYEEAAAAGSIPWYDLIPVVSYLVLRGRCRRCQTRIPLRYPVVELATGLAFAACVLMFGVSVAAFKYAVYSAILIALIASDLEERILPDEFTLGGTVVGLIFAWFVPMPVELGHFLVGPWTGWGSQGLSVSESVFGAAFASGMTWLVAWVYKLVRKREGMGFGDVKMMAMIGAFIGLSSTLVTFMLGSLMGSIIGGGYIWLKGEKAAEYELPFGSFLGVAGLVIAGYGESVMKWYMQVGK